MREARLWRRVFGLGEGVVVEGVDWDVERDALVVSVRPRRNAKLTCGQCSTPSPRYDHGDGRREWRAMDVGQVKAYLEGDAPRVNCPQHGPTVATLPWARHGARQVRWFEDQVAWLAVHTSKTAVGALMRIAWRTVGSIVARVVAEGRAARDPFDGLRRVGIDEISYKRGHHYLMVVVDHDTGRLVWAAAGHDKKTLHRAARRRRAHVLRRDPRPHRVRVGRRLLTSPVVPAVSGPIQRFIAAGRLQTCMSALIEQLLLRARGPGDRAGCRGSCVRGELERAR